MSERYCRIIFILLLAAVAVSYAVCSLNIEFLGDDIGFLRNYPLRGEPWYAWPRAVWRHWHWSNARLADMLTPPVVGVLTPGLRAVANALLTAWLFLIAARLAAAHAADRYFRSVIIAFLLCFTLRWDAVWMEFCASIVYVWAAGLTLLSLYIILKFRTPDIWQRLLLIPVCFAGAAMHEAAGVPLAVGLVSYMIANRKADARTVDSTGRKGEFSGIQEPQPKPDRWLVGAFFAGALFTLSSPMSYQRVGSMLQPEPTWQILLNSDFYFLILLLAVGLILLRKRSLDRLLRSQWIIYSVAATVSTGFLIIAGFGGRPGWFAQIYALIALFMMIPPSRKIAGERFETTVALLAAIVMGIHLYMLAAWQIRLGEETLRAITLYEKSADGVIFMDPTPDRDLPPFLMRKNHGVPDADDTYYLHRFSSFYGHGYPIVILPSRFESTDWQKFSGTRTIGTDILSSSRIPGTYGDTIFPEYPRRMLRRNGRELIETPFSKAGRTFFFYTPADRDPGEK